MCPDSYTPHWSNSTAYLKCPMTYHKSDLSVNEKVQSVDATDATATAFPILGIKIAILQAFFNSQGLSYDDRQIDYIPAGRK